MQQCTVTEEKTALRQKIKKELAGLPEDLRRAQDKALFKAFLNLEQVRAARTVMVYWGVAPEPSTVDLISALLAYGKRVVLPRCLPGGEMETRAYRGGRLVKNRWGIPEPGEDCPPVEKKDIDAVLVPALCYDRKGFRLGRGGGYYDRWLAGYAGVTVGMCYRELMQEDLPRQAHDRPVKLLLRID